MRKIGIITGTRAEYGLLKPLIKKVIEHPSLHLQLYVAGMHLSKDYGYTIQEIEKDEFPITSTIDMKIRKKNTDYDMAFSVSLGITGFAESFRKYSPDIIVVLGDRIEPLSAAIAASYMNIPVAHIHGGDVTETIIDESVRHAITKFAHLHFTSSKQSTERVLKLGEEPWRVFQVGAIGLDTVLHERLMSREEVCRKFKLDPRSPYLLVVFHPVSTEWEKAGEQMREIMAALIALQLPTIIIYPNADAGGFKIIEEINKHKDKNFIKTFKNLPHLHYLSLLKHSAALIGNSSSGIIEAPSLGVPVVNVGTRQKGRERAKNVIDVGYSKKEIIEAVEKALRDEEFLKEVRKKISPYGDGHASEKITKVLEEISIDKRLLQKRITY